MEMYQSLCVQYYDIDKPDAPEDAFQFYLQYVKEANGPILEPMSGSGRFLLPFLQLGYEVDGIDASSSMNQACLANAEKLNLTANVYEQFLNELNLPKKYNLVIIPAGSIGLITDESALKASFQKIIEHMVPGAKLVFEVDTVAYKPENFNVVTGSIRERADGAKIYFTKFADSYDENTNVMRSIHKYELFKDGKLLDSELEDFRVKLFYKESLFQLLEECGFTNIKMYKLYEKVEPENDAMEIVIECEKS